MLPFLFFIAGLCEGQLLVFCVNRFVKKKSKIGTSTGHNVTDKTN